MDLIIDDIAIPFYHKVVKSIWIHQIYIKMRRYLSISKDKKHVMLNNNADDDIANETTNDIIIKTNYIIKNFVSENYLYVIINQYIVENENKFDKIENNNDFLLKYIVEFIKKKILRSVRK